MVQRIALCLWLFVGWAGIGLAGTAGEPTKAEQKPDYYELYQVLVDTIDQVERNYVQEVDRRELIEAAIRGVLTKCDPYSAYISPEDLSRFRSTVESEFGGIGIQVSTENGHLEILSPLVNTPAYRAGLAPGDRVVEIEGQSTKGLDLDEAVRRLKGKEGTSVTLTITPRGSTEKKKVTLKREIIHLDTVLGDQRKKDDAWDFLLDPKDRIGYLRVTAFSRSTAGEIRRAMEQLKADKLRALVLDLRFNPGGLLSSAIEVSDLFISQGRIVSTKGRNSPERVWDAHKEGTFEGFPMVVLVNRYSASASEIVSACLQDHKRAVIMGERTWGKGSVQNVIELENRRSALKLTTAAYCRPSGKNIHRFDGAKDDQPWGVTPDRGFELKLGDGELRDLMHQRRQRDLVLPTRLTPPKPAPGPEKQAAGEPAPPAPAPEKPASKPDSPAVKPKDATPSASGGAPAAKPEEDRFVDRQLRMAVEYLNAQLTEAP